MNSLVSSEEIHDAKPCDGILQGNARSQAAMCNVQCAIVGAEYRS